MQFPEYGLDRVTGGVPRRPVPEVNQEPPRAAKAERTHHRVSLGGPRGTLARRSCPTDEGALDGILVWGKRIAPTCWDGSLTGLISRIGR